MEPERMSDLAEVEFDEDPTCLYRLYDTDGALLYVGITFDPRLRMEAHARQQSWWGQVTRKTMQWFPDRDAASRAEGAAMKAEQPRYNQRASSPSVPRMPLGAWVLIPPGVDRIYVQYRIDPREAAGNRACQRTEELKYYAARFYQKS